LCRWASIHASSEQDGNRHGFSNFSISDVTRPPVDRLDVHHRAEVAEIAAEPRRAKRVAQRASDASVYALSAFVVLITLEMVDALTIA